METKEWLWILATVTMLLAICLGYQYQRFRLAQEENKKWLWILATLTLLSAIVLVFQSWQYCRAVEKAEAIKVRHVSGFSGIPTNPNLLTTIAAQV